MKFSLKYLGENINNLMRRAGYFYLREEGDELSFVRPLERGGYPRFHIYVEIRQETNEMVFNLHLDQRQTVYKGVTAHAGEYEGELVEKEAERIKQALGQ